MKVPFWMLFCLGVVAEGCIVVWIVTGIWAGVTSLGAGALFHFYNLCRLRRQYWRRHPRKV